MMVTILSFLLLAQFFTPVQGKTDSASAQPLEVLDVEVLAYEYKPRAVRDPRSTSPPPGPVTAQSIPGVRGDTARREQPTIEDRSRELRGVGRRTDSQPDIARPSVRYSYEYRVRVKNTSEKKIKAIEWEYQLTEDSGSTIVSQLFFRCAKTIKPGSMKVLAGSSLSPPSRVVSADTSPDKTQTHKAVINRLEFTDGSTWMRDGFDQDAAAKGLRYCRVL